MYSNRVMCGIVEKVGILSTQKNVALANGWTIDQNFGRIDDEARRQEGNETKEEHRQQVHPHHVVVHVPGRNNEWKRAARQQIYVG